MLVRPVFDNQNNRAPDMDHASRCAGCMAEKGERAVCPHCGYDEDAAPTSPLYLPPGTLLNQRYWVGRALGEGGFGLTYLGWDSTLGVKVAIKEFLPRELAGRGTDRVSISVYQREAQAHYAYGLQKFVEEARILAKFQDHLGIVPVRDYFEDNSTGYIVMGYLDGLTLRDYLEKKGGRLPWRVALGILMPVMDALREVHAAGLLHRDISPDNIFITYQKQVKLIDFGAARLALGERSRSLSVILKPGYAPEEQYRTRGRQGPWTDVYSLAATFYRTITGQTPPESLDRLEEDSLQPPSQLGVELPGALEQVLLRGLAVRAEGRFQNMQALQTALIKTAGMGRAAEAPRPLVEPKPKDFPAAQSPAAEPKPPVAPSPIRHIQKKPGKRADVLGMLIVGLPVVVGLVFLLIELGKGEKYPAATVTPAPLAASQPQPATPTPRSTSESRQWFEPEMVSIPGGCFLMGSPASEAGRFDDERQHEVCVGAFKIGRYEVTQGQWQAVMGSNPSVFKMCGDRCPVENVSWDEVQEYIAKLNVRTGKKYRLPTEAEWEYAARAGTSTAYWWGNQASHEYANYGSDECCAGLAQGRDRWVNTAPVGSFTPNPWGLYDTAGNVWEWTCSAYASFYDGSEKLCSGKNDANTLRVYRGGSWDIKPAWVRSAYRNWNSPDYRYIFLGFRLAQGEAE